MRLENPERYTIDHLGEEHDCPCCCHSGEKEECVGEHEENGCCVVSEYDDLDHCCY